MESSSTRFFDLVDDVLLLLQSEFLSRAASLFLALTCKTAYSRLASYVSHQSYAKLNSYCLEDGDFDLFHWSFFVLEKSAQSCDLGCARAYGRSNRMQESEMKFIQKAICLNASASRIKVGTEFVRGAAESTNLSLLDFSFGPRNSIFPQNPDITMAFFDCCTVDSLQYCLPKFPYLKKSIRPNRWIRSYLKNKNYEIYVLLSADESIFFGHPMSIISSAIYVNDRALYDFGIQRRTRPTDGTDDFLSAVNFENLALAEEFLAYLHGDDRSDLRKWKTIQYILQSVAERNSENESNIPTTDIWIMVDFTESFYAIARFVSKPSDQWSPLERLVAFKFFRQNGGIDEVPKYLLFSEEDLFFAQKKTLDSFQKHNTRLIFELDGITSLPFEYLKFVYCQNGDNEMRPLPAYLKGLVDLWSSLKISELESQVRDLLMTVEQWWIRHMSSEDLEVFKKEKLSHLQEEDLNSS
jgi:hypothetical protein